MPAWAADSLLRRQNSVGAQPANRNRSRSLCPSVTVRQDTRDKSVARLRLTSDRDWLPAAVQMPLGLICKSCKSPPTVQDWKDNETAQ
jgi:hypothetical protein